MRVTILAVTDAMEGRYCVAGMTEDGAWIRPIHGSGRDRFWTHTRLIVKSNGEFTRVGDVWDISGEYPAKPEHENHVEDFMVSKRLFVERLSNADLISFVKSHAEDEEAFQDTVNGRGRSLCVIHVDTVTPYTSEYNGRVRALMKFSSSQFDVDNPHTSQHDYIVKDCKWNNLVRNGVDCSKIQNAYLCIGLATKWNGVEWPQVIGLHTQPEYTHPTDYPN